MTNPINDEIGKPAKRTLSALGGKLSKSRELVAQILAAREAAEKEFLRLKDLQQAARSELRTQCNFVRDTCGGTTDAHVKRRKQEERKAAVIEERIQRLNAARLRIGHLRDDLDKLAIAFRLASKIGNSLAELGG